MNKKMFFRRSIYAAVVHVVSFGVITFAAENKIKSVESYRSMKCPAGFYNALRITSDSEVYSTSTNTNDCTHVCEIVPYGKYSPENDDDIYTCPIGTYSKPGSSTCTLCPPGMYSFKEGSGSCFDCPPGHYAKNPGSSFCSKCQNSLYNGPGSTSVTETINEANKTLMIYCMSPRDSVSTTVVPSGMTTSVPGSTGPSFKGSSTFLSTRQPSMISTNDNTYILSESSEVGTDFPSATSIDSIKSTTKPSIDVSKISIGRCSKCYINEDDTSDRGTMRPSESITSAKHSGSPSPNPHSYSYLLLPIHSSHLGDKLVFFGGNATSTDELYARQQQQKEAKRQETISLAIRFSSFVVLLAFLGFIAYLRKKVIIKRRMEQIKIQYLVERPVPSPPPRLSGLQDQQQSTDVDVVHETPNNKYDKHQLSNNENLDQAVGMNSNAAENVSPCRNCDGQRRTCL